LLRKEPFTVPFTTKLSTATSLLKHVKVNSIADYYGVDRLVSLANAKTTQLLRKDDDNDDDSWIMGLLSAIDAATQSTGDTELQGILACAAGTNISKLLKPDEFFGSWRS
jgi:hypothetical protein